MTMYMPRNYYKFFIFNFSSFRIMYVDIRSNYFQHLLFITLFIVALLYIHNLDGYSICLFWKRIVCNTALLNCTINRHKFRFKISTIITFRVVISRIITNTGYHTFMKCSNCYKQKFLSMLLWKLLYFLPSSLGAA